MWLAPSAGARFTGCWNRRRNRHGNALCAGVPVSDYRSFPAVACHHFLTLTTTIVGSQDFPSATSNAPSKIIFRHLQDFVKRTWYLPVPEITIKIGCITYCWHFYVLLRNMGHISIRVSYFSLHWQLYRFISWVRLSFHGQYSQFSRQLPSGCGRWCPFPPPPSCIYWSARDLRTEEAAL